LITRAVSEFYSGECEVASEASRKFLGVRTCTGGCQRRNQVHINIGLTYDLINYIFSFKLYLVWPKSYPRNLVYGLGVYQESLVRSFKTGFEYNIPFWIRVLVMWIHQGYFEVKSWYKMFWKTKVICTLESFNINIHTSFLTT
jgi:hypothetical protein